MIYEVIASAPGRICLAGEDIDWSTCGSVIVGAIDIRTTVSIKSSKKLSNQITIEAVGRITDQLILELPELQPYTGHKLDYTLAALKLFQKMGISLEPMDILIRSNLPSEAGVSSSSAVCLATLGALNEYYKAGLSITDICHNAYLIEDQELKIGSGQMDMYASGLGGLLCLDNSSIPIKDVVNLHFPSNVEILLIDLEYPRLTAEAVARNRKRYASKEPQFLTYLENASKYIEELRHILSVENSSINRFGEILNQAHQNMNTYLRPPLPITKTCMEILQRHQVIGAKTSGGAKGSIIFVLAYEDQIPALVKDIKKIALKPIVTQITNKGLEVCIKTI